MCGLSAGPERSLNSATQQPRQLSMIFADGNSDRGVQWQDVVGVACGVRGKISTRLSLCRKRSTHIHTKSRSSSGYLLHSALWEIEDIDGRSAERVPSSPGLPRNASFCGSALRYFDSDNRAEGSETLSRQIAHETDKWQLALSHPTPTHVARAFGWMVWEYA